MDFSKKGIAETFLVTTKSKNKEILVGYFSLAYKITRVNKNVLKGKTKKENITICTI